MGLLCVLCSGEGWLAQPVLANIVDQHIRACSTTEHCYGHEAEIEDTALLQHNRNAIGHPSANEETQGEGPQLLTIFDDKYKKFVGLWKSCAMKALGPDEYSRRIRLVNTTSHREKYAQNA